MRRSFLILFFVAGVMLSGTVSTVFAGDPVEFSGKVKKVIPAKNKVGILDEANKKRFTVVIAETSELSGYSDFEDIKKGDEVEGHYEVNARGMYIVTDLEKK